MHSLGEENVSLNFWFYATRLNKKERSLEIACLVYRTYAQCSI